MLDKLEGIEKRFNEIGQKMLEPDLVNDNKQYIALSRELKNLTPIVKLYKDYKLVLNDINDAKEMLKTETDDEMKIFLTEEINQKQDTVKNLEEEFKIMLLPKDENDEKNVILEIRPGAGGEEASLFAMEIMRMYLKYAEKRRWKTEIINSSETELGGLKEATILIKGEGAYAKLKWESGVHRVQRVPTTEAQGRIHTSTITVAILPEAEDVEIDINEKDLKIDTYRSGGAGGQNVNKTESAVRITHLPTGIVVACQDERYQLKNKERAMHILKSKLYDYYKTQSDSQYAENRKNQVGTGDRSERIRTYNFPQGRVTDHRIGMTLYSLDLFLNGDLDEMITALTLADQKQKLESINE